MNEKNITKISLSTFFLILAVIVIIVMGIFMYKTYNEKNIATEKVSDLNGQVSNLKNTVDQLQGKINSISETINSNSSVPDTNTNNTSNNITTSFTDEEVKTALANYLELKEHAGCAAILECLTEKGDLNYDKTKDNISSKDGVHITNIKFDDYKKAMLKYVSENEFEKNWTSPQYIDKNDDGYLLRPEGGGGLRVYTIKNISKINDTTYLAKTSSVVGDNEYYEENNYTFTIKSYNGKCVIDYCNKN